MSEGEKATATAGGQRRIIPRSFWGWAEALPNWLAALALFVLMTMTFFDVILRSALSNPIESATELTRIFMAIIVFASLPSVTWRGGHIVVDLMDPFFTRRAARLRDTLIDLICGLALLWPAWRVWELAERARSYGDTTEYLHFPKFITGWFIAAFCLVTAGVFLARGVMRVVAPSKVPS
ncbi:TRAP-type C4-dicarboxylate transport system, small permease component [Meinhardsimonia xiamenensis]|jgi:TRAP-type C4-dicarboxylate transport system permease small subunit|uniref:TRAP transporter small permease protein n=1 Tax=Meinhardsimonia xiamenensis TaxID=990712 RepID=A0A1G8YIW6_9RHOB|nr:TRAP transporter small permease subunit [Meinhardsimonia xiamenensis]PRX37318.1 TRAP-type C4-dicarboxylate transport system permease small subunit [Meinhardsimonia xiamenensis]SDK02643.1 TRAP-type C4-dicarboxylate transport system, small permease component [Meinhardsimonia xiamenensis]